MEWVIELPHIAIFPLPCYHLAMSSTLQSTKSVTYLDFTDEDVADFSSERVRIAIDKVTWRDMGSPDMITVTIEPGDRLNG